MARDENDLPVVFEWFFMLLAASPLIIVWAVIGLVGLAALRVLGLI